MACGGSEVCGGANADWGAQSFKSDGCQWREKMPIHNTITWGGWARAQRRTGQKQKTRDSVRRGANASVLRWKMLFVSCLCGDKRLPMMVRADNWPESAQPERTLRDTIAIIHKGPSALLSLSPLPLLCSPASQPKQFHQIRGGWKCVWKSHHGRFFHSRVGPHRRRGKARVARHFYISAFDLGSAAHPPRFPPLLPVNWLGNATFNLLNSNVHQA